VLVKIKVGDQKLQRGIHLDAAHVGEKEGGSGKTGQNSRASCGTNTCAVQQKRPPGVLLLSGEQPHCPLPQSRHCAHSVPAQPASHRPPPTAPAPRAATPPSRLRQRAAPGRRPAHPGRVPRYPPCPKHKPQGSLPQGGGRRGKGVGDYWVWRVESHTGIPG
jgi:hypothetical protein